MPQISIKINNRVYRLSCGDGEEARLTELAEHVRAKAEQLTAEHGRIADDHLMLMSAVLVADELWDERAAAKAAGRSPAAGTASASNSASAPSMPSAPSAPGPSARPQGRVRARAGEDALARNGDAADGDAVA